MYETANKPIGHVEAFGEGGYVEEGLTSVEAELLTDTDESAAEVSVISEPQAPAKRAVAVAAAARRVVVRFMLVPRSV